MILVRNIRLPLSAAEPQAFEKALHTLRVPRSKVEHTGVAKLSVDARHGQPKLVIPRSFICIAQNLICFSGFLKFGFGFRISRIQIRMILFRQLSVSLFDFILRGAL